ncbi:hypothetical protein AVEN_142041-1, partial [Araneus ventricosus]
NGETSPITDIFAGEYIFTKTCSFCNNKSYNLEKFNIMRVPVLKKCGLMDCIIKTLEEDHIDGYFCNECQQTTNIRRQGEISKLPPVLVIQFLRFHYSYEGTKKINEEINIPHTLRLEVQGAIQKLSNYAAW